MKLLRSYFQSGPLSARTTSRGKFREKATDKKLLNGLPGNFFNCQPNCFLLNQIMHHKKSVAAPVFHNCHYQMFSKHRGLSDPKKYF